MVLNDPGPTHKDTTKKLSKAAIQLVYSQPEALTSRPEFFRLPRSGERDPHFGLARSFYYAAETDGQLKLVRVKKRGNQRGVTLIPYAAVIALLNEAHSTCT
jgi:hypothetical protein